MKAFSIAAAVTLVLAFVCLVGSSPLPLATEAEQEEARSNDTPVADLSRTVPDELRVKRQLSQLQLCPWICSRLSHKGFAPCKSLPCPSL